MNSSNDFRDPASPSSGETLQVSDADLNHALEAHPPIAIPDGFARSVLSALPVSDSSIYSLAVRRRTRWAEPAPGSLAAPQIGRRVAFAGACLLFAIIVLLALHTPHAEAGHPILALALGSTFALEFILLTLWLALRPDTLS